MTQTALAKRLAQLKREVRRELRGRGTRLPPAVRTRLRRLRSIDATTASIAIAKAILLIALPFVVYVRGSVELHGRGWAPWLAVTGGMLLTVGVVVAIAAWITRRFRGRARVQSAIRWAAVPIVVAWTAAGLFHLSRDNAKSEDVRQHFSQVHPVLRAALATAILLDPGMTVTDLARVEADYARMGLPVNERTKHYRQASGWVHAVDIRTRERGEIRNRGLQLYFWMMGFSTLRHVGTADHLHVQLR